ncbi:hypothetical protein [Streptomyces sp. RerS4]|uniref:hypothetical protein n=1 Tax=Streptomyces sp. RerS4 TaxID=2942449 RepID=UPI00201BF44A|nr:hypothetical protein [Streptomyces sp. RerS4]UQX01010.1 hypothetical protein M4D82_11055 [Streptomyces sp. RerS4]
MSADNFPAVNCDGPDCRNATHHPLAHTVTEVRRIRREDGWHTRSGGRDLCPSCWKAGHR